MFRRSKENCPVSQSLGIAESAIEPHSVDSLTFLYWCPFPQSKSSGPHSRSLGPKNFLPKWPRTCASSRGLFSREWTPPLVGGLFVLKYE